MNSFDLVMMIDDGTVVRVPFADRRSANDAANVIGRAGMRGDTGMTRLGNGVLVGPVEGIKGFGVMPA